MNTRRPEFPWIDPAFHTNHCNFPAEELLVAGRKYWTAGGSLQTLRDSQSHRNTPAGRGERQVPAAVAGDGSMAG